MTRNKRRNKKEYKYAQKSQGLLVLDNMNSKFKGVKKATGKRVERGSDVDKDAKQRKFDRAATWAEVVAM